METIEKQSGVMGDPPAERRIVLPNDRELAATETWIAAHRARRAIEVARNLLNELENVTYASGFSTASDDVAELNNGPMLEAINKVDGVLGCDALQCVRVDDGSGT